MSSHFRMISLGLGSRAFVIVVYACHQIADQLAKSHRTSQPRLTSDLEKLSRRSLSELSIVTNLTSHGAFIRYKPRSHDNKINEERICSIVKGLKYTKVQFASKIVFQFFVCLFLLVKGRTPRLGGKNSER